MISGLCSRHWSQKKYAEDEEGRVKIMGTGIKI